MIFDIIILGSGPAGLTAAIYASRALRKTLVISGTQPGGQLTTTTEIENFPGFAKGILGPVLMQQMQEQATRFGAEIATDIVRNIKVQMSHDKSNENTSKVQTFIISGQEQVYEAKAVIVAVGAQAKTLGIPSEDQFRGKGISYCATCDGFFFRGKNVAVLGGGDTAMEDATFLTKFASHVTIIHRRTEFRASPIMVEKAKKDAKITFLLNKTVEAFTGDTIVTGITLKDNTTGKEEQFSCDGVFVAIGHTPATEFLKGTIDMDEKGYIRTDGKCQMTNLKSNKENSKVNSTFQTATSVPGIFAAGDCVDSHYRQAIVAAGMGCQAAMDTEVYLNSSI